MSYSSYLYNLPCSFNVINFLGIKKNNEITNRNLNYEK